MTRNAFAHAKGTRARAPNERESPFGPTITANKSWTPLTSTPKQNEKQKKNSKSAEEKKKSYEIRLYTPIDRDEWIECDGHGFRYSKIIEFAYSFDRRAIVAQSHFSFRQFSTNLPRYGIAIGVRIHLFTRRVDARHRTSKTHTHTHNN